LGVVSLMSTTRENLTEGKRKGNRSQSSEHLRPGNNCILRRIIRSQLRVNKYSVFLRGILYQFQFFLSDNLSVNISYCLVNYSVVLLLDVVSSMAGSTTGTDVSWIRRIPNCNAAALLHNNIRNDQLLHRGCTVWFTVKPPRIQIITPQLVLLLELHYQSARVLRRGS
jgi:hypothetical protein